MDDLILLPLYLIIAYIRLIVFILVDCGVLTTCAPLIVPVVVWTAIYESLRRD